MRVVIDPGHGGTERAGKSTPFGARGATGTAEKDVILALARRVADRLGGDAALTREGDVNLSLGDRIDAARRLGAAVFVSLHADAGPPGAQAWVHPGAGAASHALARRLTGELARLAGGAADPPQASELAILAPERHGSRTAACLLEVGSLGDPDGERSLRDPRSIDALAAAIARGIALYGGTLTAHALEDLASPRRHTFPWIGRIANTPTAALRSTPHKDPDNPYVGIIDDLDAGTEVRVFNQSQGWLNVAVNRGGTEEKGWVSRELIEYVSASAFEAPPLVVHADLPTLAGALVILRRAEMQHASQATPLAPDDEVDGAIIKIRQQPRYDVDADTFRVTFMGLSESQPTLIETIEDFVLFADQVEAAYPWASPEQVAAELRQMFYGTPHWAILSAGTGIIDDAPVLRFTDIENKTTSAIARLFDLPTFKHDHRVLDTRLGRVDIGHVLAGIDTALNGFPPSYPQAFLAAIGHDDLESDIQYDVMAEESGRDTRDFATWAGDLGQAYATFLIDRFVDKGGQTLATVAAGTMKPEEILGDIHGYIALAVAGSLASPPGLTGVQRRVSNVLRDLYFVDKPSPRPSYRMFLEQVAQRSGDDLRPFVVERSRHFARIWYAKLAFSRGRRGGGSLFDPEGIVAGLRAEFDHFHEFQMTNGDGAEQLDSLAWDFTSNLDVSVL
jgi:hypothetical protein